MIRGNRVHHDAYRNQLTAKKVGTQETPGKALTNQPARFGGAEPVARVTFHTAVDHYKTIPDGLSVSDRVPGRSGRQIVVLAAHARRWLYAFYRGGHDVIHDFTVGGPVTHKVFRLILWLNTNVGETGPLYHGYQFIDQ